MPDSPSNLTGEAPPPERGAWRPRQDQGPTGWRESLPGLLSAIRLRRWTLAGTILAVTLSAGLILHQMTPCYTATGALIYQASEYQTAVRQDPINDATMSSQAEVLQSLRIAQRVAERGNLFADPAFNPALRPPGPLRQALAYVRLLLGLEEEAPPDQPPALPVRDRARELTIMAVQGSLHAAPVRFSHVLEVTFTAEDPVVAANAVNNAMDAYIKGLYADRHKKVDEATGQFEEQERKLRAAVQKDEERVATYRGAHAMSQGIHAGTDTEQITRLLEALATARADQAGADAKLDAARGQRGAEAQAAVAPSVVQLRAQQDRVAAQMQAEQGRLGSAHPIVQGLTRQLAEGQRALAAETGRVVAAIEADQHAAAERVKTLEVNLRDAEKRAQESASEQIPLNAMTRDLDADRVQLQTVQDRSHTIAHQTWIEFPEAHEISQALPPEHPSAPKTVQAMAAAGAASVFLGLLLVYLLQLNDETVHSGADIRLTTGLHCFALIPEVSKRALGGFGIDEYAVRRPQTMFAEQIRTLRTALSLSAHRPQVVAITAVGPGEGKSILTLSLGRSAQASGERVLAIECDVRQPSFQRRLGRPPAPGLMDILRGAIDWHDAVQDDTLTGMHFIPAGKAGGDIVGYFLSADMRRLLDAARASYDLILLDSPPAEGVAEARIAAALADATLMCVRWRSTRRAALNNTLELLSQAHAKVIGTVMTRVDPRAHLRADHADAGIYHRRYRAYYGG
jgi:capsular exopolysaccharide synthesis family protein